MANIQDIETQIQKQRQIENELAAKRTQTQQRRIELGNYLNAITPTTPIDDIAKAETELAALARVIPTIDASINAALALRTRHENDRTYWAGKAEDLTRQADASRRRISELEREIRDALGRAEKLRESIKGVEFDIVQAEAQRRDIVGEV